MRNPDLDASDIGDLTSVVNSSALRRVLGDRKEYLQKEVNRFVREQNLIQAFGALMRLDDIEKMYLVIEDKIAELKKEA